MLSKGAAPFNGKKTRKYILKNVAPHNLLALWVVEKGINSGKYITNWKHVQLCWQSAGWGGGGGGGGGASAVFFGGD